MKKHQQIPSILICEPQQPVKQGLTVMQQCLPDEV